MKISAEEILELVQHPESTTLDVKRDQYYLSKDNKVRQSEVIKDVLAFANTDGETDAYILIGVKEEKPPPHTIVEISAHADDSDLQEFVNKKMNKKIHFLYQEVQVCQHIVGVICIRPQKGPTDSGGMPRDNGGINVELARNAFKEV